MAKQWQWASAVVAISAGDKYFEAARAEESNDTICRIGDCVQLVNERGRELLAIVTALWEARDGVKMVEARQLFHELALVRQLQETPANNLPIISESIGDVPKVWESNKLEVVPLSWIDRKVQASELMDASAVQIRANANSSGAGATVDGVEHVIVGFFDVNVDRLQRLPPQSSRLERSRQCSVRARGIMVDENEEPSARVGQKRHRADTPSTATPSPEAQAAIAKLRTVCQELLLSHAPDETTAREDERDMIQDHLHGAIKEGASSGALYISGLPGTGKTSIVREVVRHLETERSHGVLPDFVYMEINGLHLPKPENAYVSMWKAVTGLHDVPRSLTPAKLCTMLAHEFEKGNASRRPTILLVLDEMDFLVTGKSVVLYNILEWQACRGSKLVVVGIANTMDLPERLEQKVRSRLGSNRLIFSSYTSTQLESIVRQRLASLDVFSLDAIQICCKFVAQASGDARQALTLCRRAAEVAIERLSLMGSVPAVHHSQSILRERCTVTAEDLQAAQMATSVSAPLIRLRDCRKFECVFLIALRMEVKRSDKDDAAFENVLNRFAVLCNTHSLTPVPRLRDLLLLCEELSRSGILQQSYLKSSRYPKLMLRCSPQEIYDVFLAHPIGRQLLT